MAQFKIGDPVRLKGSISPSKAGRNIEEHTQGQILEVNGGTYTVQFTDAKAAVEGVTEDEIEADT